MALAEQQASARRLREEFLREIREDELEPQVERLEGA
jgi:hypothetical protein